MIYVNLMPFTFKITVDTRARERLLDGLKRMPSAIKKDLKDSIQESAYDFRDTAKSILLRSLKHPEFSTGNLIDSIKASKVNDRTLTAEVGPDMVQAPYAEWVEFGHFMRDGSTYFPGHHYMTRAWEEAKERNAVRITKKLKGALKNYVTTINRRTKSKKTGKFV